MMDKEYEEKAQKAQSGHRKSRKEAISWALVTLRICCGGRLPGEPSPDLVEELFKQQSSNWIMLGSQHIDNANWVCTNFFCTLLNEVAKPVQVENA